MLKVIDIKERKKWNEIVKSFKRYDVYYLNEYVRTFQLHGDGEPNLFYYSDSNIKAINVVMKKDIGEDLSFKGKIPRNKYFDLSTPYGYGGYLIEGNINSESIENLNYEYELYCKGNNIVSEFVRFHPILNNAEKLNKMYNIKPLGKTISIDLKSIDYIWENFTSKNRNVIRKAIKNDVKIHWGNDSRLMNNFIDMYESTMDRDEANEYYYFKDDFYKSIEDDLKYNSIIFYATYKQEIISMAIILFGNNNMHYHLSASNREYSNLAANNLLLYEAASWGSINGYKTFHLGGGLGSKQDSLYKFKKAFNREFDNLFFVGEKIFNNELYNYFVELLISKENYDMKDNFFPLYRS